MPGIILETIFFIAPTSRFAAGLYWTKAPKGMSFPLKSLLCLSWYGVESLSAGSHTFRKKQ